MQELKNTPQKSITNNNQLLPWIKEVVLKYCPLFEDRLDLLGNTKAPELDINIYFEELGCYIYFMYGTSAYKTNLCDKTSTNIYISLDELIDLIGFLVNDHEIISFIDFKKINEYNLENTNELLMIFSINWSDKAIKGLSVGDIELKINFGKNDTLIKEYVSTILNKYKTQLEQTKTFKKMKSKYIDQLKELYFKSLTKDEMINYIIGMNDEDIRTLLLNIDNDTFTNYYVINNKSTPSSTYKKQLKEVKKNK